MRITIDLPVPIGGLNVYQESENIKDEELSACDGVILFERYIKKDYGLTANSVTIDHAEVTVYSTLEECISE